MGQSTVLLLESDDLTMARMSTVLAQEADKYQLLQAYSFKEAFDKVKVLGRSLSLVILDFELATDDVDILERLRKLDFDKPLPVLLMGEVALAADEIAQLRQDSGYAGYIYKTMPDVEMLATIKRHVEGEERRASPRVFFETRVHCVFNDRSYIAQSYAINRNGAFLKLSGALPAKGTQGTLTFNAALGDGKRPVHQNVEVVFVRAYQDNTVSIYPAGLGVKFLEPSTETLAALDELVQIQVQSGKMFSES